MTNLVEKFLRSLTRSKASDMTPYDLLQEFDSWLTTGGYVSNVTGDSVNKGYIITLLPMETDQAECLTIVIKPKPLGLGESLWSWSSESYAKDDAAAYLATLAEVAVNIAEGIKELSNEK